MKMSTEIGILGDGQLARMLGESSLRLGHQPIFLSRFKNSPVSSLPKLRQFSSVEEVLVDSKLAIIESEFLDLGGILGAEKVFPDRKCLSRMSDKLQQKKTLDSLGIPSLGYELISSPSQLENLGLPKMLKTSRLGYDGNGNFLFRNQSQDAEAARAFVENAKSRSLQVYAEDFIQFDHELAILSCSDREMNVVTFPLVETHQAGSVFLWVKSNEHLNKKFRRTAELWVKKIVDSLKLYGTFAIECFVVGGELFVNEIAPRVHNSGHFSMNAANLSQFDLHVLAATNQRLQEIQTKAFFGMWNLLGEGENLLPRLSTPGETQLTDNSSFYWYGKSEARKARKMGHLNVWGDTAAEFESSWRQSKEWIENFWKS